MRALAIPLLLAACQAAPSQVETDTQPDVPDTPSLDVEGEWYVADADLLPNQEPDWCATLTVARFPNYDGCFADVVACRRKLRFAPNHTAWLYYELVATSCDGTGAEEAHTPFGRYGNWSFLERSERGDLYQINAMNWDISELGPGDLEVVHAGLVFHLDAAVTDSGS